MSLANILMLSEKRRNILLLLQEGPKDSKEIKCSLNSTWDLLKHPIKELKEDGLITHDNGVYGLSNTGKMMIESAFPLLSMLDAFEENTSYWNNRDLAKIPKDLRKRIGEIGDYELVVPDVDHMFEPFKNFIIESSNTNYLKAVLVMFNPAVPAILSEIVERGVEISLVLTENYVKKLKDMTPAELNKLLSSKNTDIFVFNDDIKPPQIMLTDHNMTIIIFDQKGKYDYKELVNSDEKALNWGQELFMYYKHMARPLTEI